MPSIRALKRRHDQRRRHQLAVWRAPPALASAVPRHLGRCGRLQAYQQALLRSVARALRLPPALLLRRAVPPARQWSASRAVFRAASSAAPVCVDPRRSASVAAFDEV